MTDETPFPEHDLRQVDRLIARVVDEPHPVAASVLGHLHRAGGRRLRPRLAILSGRVADPQAAVATPAPLVAAAAAVELVHLGTLLHDDVIDGGTVRRGAGTVNSLWGSPMAILAGDYLLARATQVAGGIGREPGESVADCICAMVRGQMLETSSLFDVGRPVDEYLAAIEGKTARLVAVSCGLGARALGAGDDLAGALERFGRHLGVAYQLVDDLVDLCLDEAAAGKPTGVDIREGVYTLPVLHAVREQPGLAGLLGPGISDADVARVRDAVLASSGPAEARAAIAREVESAYAALRSAARRAPAPAAVDPLHALATELSTAAATLVGNPVPLPGP